MNDQVDELVNAGLKRMKSTEWMRQVDDIKTMLQEEGRKATQQIQPEEMDRPTNRLPQSASIAPPRMREEDLNNNQVWREVSREAPMFIDAVDQLYNGNYTPDARYKELERIFNYYTNTKPNVYLRGLANDQGNIEGQIMDGNAPIEAARDYWREARKKLLRIARDPFGTGGGLV